MHDDVLTGYATPVIFADQVRGVKEMGELRGHAGRSRRGNEWKHGSRAITRFLQQLTPRGVCEGFTHKFRFIPHQACRDFDHPTLHGDAELLDEDDFQGRGDGEDAHAGLCIWTADKIPSSDAINPKPWGFQEGFGNGRHKIGQETVAQCRKGGYFFRSLMSRYDFQIPVTFKHRIVFTRDAFSPENPALAEILAEGGGRRAMVFVEEAVALLWPDLVDEIQTYFANLDLEFRGTLIFQGGEAAKADDNLVREVWEAIDSVHLDRHSYALVIGGGAFLDAVGYAAATAHRGVRLLRFPTTTLSQDDSGVGVKCAINALGKKNWVGAFAVPFAVINDFRYLHSQDEETRRGGLIEAVKVALVRDRGFFEWIEENLPSLAALDPAILEECVEKSALLHARHIAEGGDPFETGSSRPLDFGHWAAHKLEAMTSYQLFHAPAVGIGVALDTLYSARVGLLKFSVADQILRVLDGLGISIYHPALDWLDESGRRRVLAGLDEFREHLGGELTVMLLQDLGQGVDTHQFDEGLLGECINELRTRWESHG
jgi:3-dehydroquinate synthase